MPLTEPGAGMAFVGERHLSMGAIRIMGIRILCDLFIAGQIGALRDVFELSINNNRASGYSGLGKQ